MACKKKKIEKSENYFLKLSIKKVIYFKTSTRLILSKKVYTYKIIKKQKKTHFCKTYRLFAPIKF